MSDKKTKETTSSTANFSFSIEKLNLGIIPFGRRGSRLMVIEGFPDPEASDGAPAPLCVAYSYGEVGGKSRFDYIRFWPVYNGEIVPYEYEATPSLVTVKTNRGQIEICFDGEETLQFRASGGVGIHFALSFEPHEQFLDRYDGTVYAAFAQIGEYLFEVTAGTQSHNGKWIARAIRPANCEMDWVPDQQGELRAYIRYSESSVVRPELRPFDQCVKENLDDFNAWCEKYPPVPVRYAHIRLFAIYVIWVSYVAPKGLIKVPMVYMMRTGALMRAMGWHQNYQAMALWPDIDEAVDLLYSMFTLQDEYGQLPDGGSDRYVTMTAPKPPFQGFAIDYIISRIGGYEKLTAAHCEKLYTPMCKWIEWWYDFRDRDGDGMIGYVHGDESGWDDASIFSKGMPVEAPDIAAFLVMCMESCSKFADKLGLVDESAAWQKRSTELLNKLVGNLWNGEKFICRLDETHEVIDVESIAVYQPIILGKRLPKEVIDKIADKVGREDTFLMPNGFASESQLSEYYDVTNGAFMLGTILAPVQMMMTVGLYMAGRKDVALENCRRWCEMSLEFGPQVIAPSPPQKNPPSPPEGRAVLARGGRRTPGSYSSWGAPVFLVLANLLYEEEKNAEGSI